MKATIVIPTYWTGPTGKPTDRLINIYDHPTPVSEEGTLERTLESLVKLEGDFNVCIIGTMTEPDYFKQFETKLVEMLSKFKDRLKIYWFSHSELEKFHNKLFGENLSFQQKYLSLEGYSNIRNLCIIIPHILRSEAAILIDDDEVISDPKFVAKAIDYLGGEFDGQSIIGKTGYYVNGKGEHLGSDKIPWYDRIWKKGYLMNQVLKTIKEEPRLKKTSLALGGGMVVHRNLFMKVSFDPWITRGEDIDYLVNAKLQGIDFYLDNELFFIHLPPDGTKSRVLGCRQDFFRFYYERAKLKAAFKNRQFQKFNIKDLDPYPGPFLRKSVYIKAMLTSFLLTIRGIFVKEDRGQIKNIKTCFWDALRYSSKNKRNYFRFQKGWPSFMEHISEGYENIIRKI
jgi:hypothetical protein